MRFVGVILVLVQLLLRGVAVPHCHAHDGQTEPIQHGSRPHAHVLPHSHSHATKRDGSQHGHAHHHGHSHQVDESPVKPEPVDSLPQLPEHDQEHDQDAVYTGSEPLAAPLDRIQAPEPAAAHWFLLDIQAENDAGLVHLIEYRTTGPPGVCFGTSIDLLPHLLRV